ECYVLHPKPKKKKTEQKKIHVQLVKDNGEKKNQNTTIQDKPPSKEEEVFQTRVNKKYGRIRQQKKVWNQKQVPMNNANQFEVLLDQEEEQREVNHSPKTNEVRDKEEVKEHETPKA
ncbi:hypothetical protein HAX54_047909, partial [Datura stramonium]|nr:hypothetical protein [Datura stramonium]